VAEFTILAYRKGKSSFPAFRLRFCRPTRRFRTILDD
jgi:hypothetical protein